MRADPISGAGTTARALLRVGSVAAANGDPELAVASFKELITRFPGLPEYSGPARLDLASVYQELGEPDRAEEAYLSLLGLEGVEHADRSGARYPYDPLATLKHRASRDLAQLYLEQGRYSKAQRFHDLSIERYRSQSFCGNAHAQQNMNNKVFQSRIYQAQGYTGQAIEVLLPDALHQGVADNSDLVGEVLSLLRARYSERELRDLFE